MATKKKCDYVCISREEFERLQAQCIGKSTSKPKKAAGTTKKAVAKKTAPKKTVKKTVKAKTTPKTVSAPRTTAMVPVKTTTAPKKTVKKTVKAKTTPKTVSAPKKTAKLPKKVKEPKSKTYKKKTTTKKTKKDKIVKADYTIIRDEPVRYEGKVLERRESSRSLPAPKTTIVRDKEVVRTEHRSILDNLRRNKDAMALSEPSSKVMVEETKQISAPKTETTLVKVEETKALPAPKDDADTVTLSASDYKVQDYEDCSQGGFFERAACRRRNRKLSRS